eukprot:1157037-Pelagomonas_calceolata.AAC.9
MAAANEPSQEARSTSACALPQNNPSFPRGLPYVDQSLCGSVLSRICAFNPDQNYHSPCAGKPTMQYTVSTVRLLLLRPHAHAERMPTGAPAIHSQAMPGPHKHMTPSNVPHYRSNCNSKHNL